MRKQSARGRAVKGVRQQAEVVTKLLNQIYARRPAKIDPAFKRAQLRSLDKGSW
jgi:hypothetical protein